MSRQRFDGLTVRLGGDGLLAADTSVTFDGPLEAADGAVPTLGAGEYLPFTIYDVDGNVVEIVHLTAYTTGATTGTILRAQEGTTAVDHDAGVIVDHAPTAADFAEKVTATGTITKMHGPITQAAYDALTPDADTLYVIVG